MEQATKDEIMHWTTRINVRRAVRDAVEAFAEQETRSVATMIGILLAEAVEERAKKLGAR